jgi:hypothetical protein
MDITVPATSSSALLYVELSGVIPERDGGGPSLTPVGWSTASDGFGRQYSIGHSYPVRPGHYSLQLDFTFGNCACYEVSGPYVATAALAVDPLTLPPHGGSSDGVTMTQLVQTEGPTPGKGQGRYYYTSLTSIAQDEIYLDGIIPSDASVVESTPGSPSNYVPGAWAWTNTPGASTTFSDPAKLAIASNSVFYDGILLGIAGAGVIALVPETFSTIEKAKERKKKRAKPAPEEPSHAAASDSPARQGLPISPTTASSQELPAREIGNGVWVLSGVAGGIVAGWALTRRLGKRA